MLHNNSFVIQAHDNFTKNVLIHLRLFSRIKHKSGGMLLSITYIQFNVNKQKEILIKPQNFISNKENIKSKGRLEEHR